MGEKNPCVLRSFLTALGVATCLMCASPALARADYLGFPDVSGQEWFVSDGSLSYAIERGLMTGFSDGRFGPADTVTRGQVATVLWRMAGRPRAWSGSFIDVDYSAYYGDAIRWVHSEGIMTGYDGSSHFGPDDPMTREQLAKVVVGYARLVGADVSSSDRLPFVDADQISPWAAEPMAWCAEKGIITGDPVPSGMRANPRGTAARGQLAKIISVLHREVVVPSLGYEPEPVYATDDYVMLAGTIVEVHWTHLGLGPQTSYAIRLDRPATFANSYEDENYRVRHVDEVQIWDGATYDLPIGRRVVLRGTVMPQQPTQWYIRDATVNDTSVILV